MGTPHQAVYGTDTQKQYFTKGNMHRKKGFTLIELLVVVLIIGILAAIAFPQYQIAVLKSRTAEMLTNIRGFAEAHMRHKLATGQYPTSFYDLDITMPCTISADGNSCTSDKYTYRRAMGTQPTINADRNGIMIWVQLPADYGPYKLFCRAQLSYSGSKEACISLGGKPASYDIEGYYYQEL